MRNAVIKGAGFFAPEKIVPNSFFNEILGEDVDTWLRENLTIKERRWCSENESTIDLCLAAAQNAIEDAAISASNLDLIIVATDTPEFISPSTASILQHKLAAEKCGTFDVNTACAGFVTALDIASKFIIADENYRNVLVIGAYAMSKYLDLTDKKTVTLFADGAGAVVLSSSETKEKGFLTSQLFTAGEYNSWMGIYAGGTSKPLTKEVLDNKDHLLKFVKKFPKEINPLKWSAMISESCEKIGIKPTDINHYFFTQININGIWETLDILGVDRSKGYTIMDKYGYTGSACIPMAFADAKEKGIIKENDLVVFMGSGGGLAFANAIFKI